MKSEIPEQNQTDQKLSENVHTPKNYCKSISIFARRRVNRLTKYICNSESLKNFF